jgi:hypothetical protein
VLDALFWEDKRVHLWCRLFQHHEIEIEIQANYLQYVCLAKAWNGWLWEDGQAHINSQFLKKAHEEPWRFGNEDAETTVSGPLPSDHTQSVPSPFSGLGFGDTTTSAAVY